MADATNAINFELITPAKIMANVAISELTANGALGEFGVLPGHADMVAKIEPGVLRYREASGEQRTVATSGGYVLVDEGRIIALVDSAEFHDEVNKERAVEALEKARALVSEMDQYGPDYADARQALLRAEARLRATGYEPQDW